MSSKNNPYGDDAGTRVGRPSEPKRATDAQADGSPTGAGQEATRGIQKGPGRQDSGKEARTDSGKRGAGDPPGSEPLDDRSTEHVSGYGGEKGKPKRSSDQR